MIHRTLLLLSLALLVSCMQAQTVTLSSDTVSGLPGSQVQMEVRAMDFVDMISMQGTIEFDPQIITFDSVHQFGLPDLSSNSFGTSLIASGKLTFSWNDNTLQGITVADSTVLFLLAFSLDGNPGTGSAVEFTDVPTPLEFVDLSFNPIPYSVVHGRVEIEDTLSSLAQPVAALDKLHLAPHPATGSSRLTFTLDRPEIVSIRLWDVRGSVLFETCRFLEPGLQEIRLEDLLPSPLLSSSATCFLSVSALHNHAVLPIIIDSTK